MDASHVQKCRQHLASRLPLIGAWLQAQAVKTLVADGSAEAVRVLEDIQLVVAGRGTVAGEREGDCFGMPDQLEHGQAS